MNQNTKRNIVSEIDDMFVQFFNDNLKKFSSQMPSMVVDGTIQPYHACLPTRVTNKLQAENSKMI